MVHRQVTEHMILGAGSSMMASLVGSTWRPLTAAYRLGIGFVENEAVNDCCTRMLPLHATRIAFHFGRYVHDNLQ